MLGKEIVTTSLSIRLLTEDECKKVLGDPDAEIIEWETNGLTFVKSSKHLGIVRTGAMGGDVANVHGGWKYLNFGHLIKEWREIKLVSRAFTREKRPGNFREIIVDRQERGN